jgi:hypothetical protein
MKNVVFVDFVALFLCQCQGDQLEKWSSVDLLEHGIPLSVLAPDSIQVDKMNLGGILQDVTLRKGDDYFIQIYASDAATNDVTKLKADQMAEVKTNRFFTRVIEEDDQGFIYETQIDSLTNFGFRYVHLQADREYIFQTGLTGTYSLDEVKRMYEAVQQGPN